jgi:hypothetical protein
MQPIAPGSSQGTEFFFKIDKANLKIVEITKRPSTPLNGLPSEGAILLKKTVKSLFFMTVNRLVPLPVQ